MRARARAISSPHGRTCVAGAAGPTEPCVIHIPRCHAPRLRAGGHICGELKHRPPRPGPGPGALGWTRKAVCQTVSAVLGHVRLDPRLRGSDIAAVGCQCRYVALADRSQETVSCVCFYSRSSP